jgi:hypothetical protein
VAKVKTLGLFDFCTESGRFWKRLRESELFGGLARELLPVG